MPKLEPIINYGFNKLIMIKQCKPYGCGVYSVANSLGLKEFVTDDRIELSRNGNNIGHLSKWLQNHDDSIYIDPLYYSHLLTNIPKDLLILNHFNEDNKNGFVPILIQCNVLNGMPKGHHLVGVRIYFDHCVLYDSLMSSEIEMPSLKYISEIYNIYYGMFTFNNIDTGDILMMR